MAGVVAANNFWNQNPTTPSPSIGPTAPVQYGSPNTFSAAVNTQGADYDRIMGQYKDLISKVKTNTPQFTPIAPQTAQYTKSADVTKSLGALENLTSTGGYSEADKQNIRARGTSPIRSIYANAQRNMERNRALSGGYSPNFNAAAAKMAREESERVAGATTDIEAGIAERVAQNKLSIAPSYAGYSGQENAARNSVNQQNANIINETNKFNSNLALQSNASRDNMILQAIQGMNSLYGTNPALISLFGNQVATGANLAQGQQQVNNQKQSSIFNSVRA